MSDGISVRVGATTANLGGGFDSLGMALGLYLDVRAERAEKWEIVSDGKPDDFDGNLICRAMRRVFDRTAAVPPPHRLISNSEIPRASGLGSSAACIVAGVTLGNALIGNKLSEREVIDLCVELDGHPDNVLPAILGGVTAGYIDDGGNVDYLRAEVPYGLFCAVATPDFPLPTEKARKVLPDMYSRADCVYSLSRASVVFGAIALGRFDMLRAAGDRLHQPYRIPLIKGYDDVTHALRTAGALGVCLSGAGPSVIGFFTDGESHISLPSGWTLRMLTPENTGASLRLLTA